MDISALYNDTTIAGEGFLHPFKESISCFGRCFRDWTRRHPELGSKILEILHRISFFIAGLLGVLYSAPLATIGIAVKFFAHLKYHTTVQKEKRAPILPELIQEIDDDPMEIEGTNFSEPNVLYYLPDQEIKSAFKEYLGLLWAKDGFEITTAVNPSMIFCRVLYEKMPFETRIAEDITGIKKMQDMIKIQKFYYFVVFLHSDLQPDIKSIHIQLLKWGIELGLNQITTLKIHPAGSEIESIFIKETEILKLREKILELHSSLNAD